MGEDVRGKEGPKNGSGLEKSISAKHPETQKKKRERERENSEKAAEAWLESKDWMQAIVSMWPPGCDVYKVTM